MERSFEHLSRMNLISFFESSFSLKRNEESHYASFKGPALTLHKFLSFLSCGCSSCSGLPSSLHNTGSSFSRKKDGFKTNKHFNSSKVMTFDKHNMFKPLNSKEIDSNRAINTLIFPPFCLSSNAFAQNSECLIRDKSRFKRRKKYELSVALILGKSPHSLLPHYPLGCRHKEIGFSCCT